MSNYLSDGIKGGDDWTIDQDWSSYTPAQHNRWDKLYQRMVEVLPGRASPEFLNGLKALDLGRGGIPNFKIISEELMALTGWQVVAVPGLVPDEVFFEHLANRRFPAGNFIRRPEQMEYIQEPDVFHDVFGHVPMLTDPVFADYMVAYGEGGLRGLRHNCLKNLAALYWYTVEFGLIQTAEGLRIYGAGILSSTGESQFSLEDASPNRIAFDIERLMRTEYRIDDYQQSYFVIDSYEQLFRATVDTDFLPLYQTMGNQYDYQPADTLLSDTVLHKGSQVYANSSGRLARQT